MAAVEDPNEKLVLLVKSGSPGRRRLLASLAKIPHIRLVCMNEAENWAATYIRDWIIDPMVDAAQGLAAVKAYMATYGVTFDAVFSYDEYGVELSADIAHALHLPTVSPANMAIVRNKLALRELCQQQGVPVPKFARLNGAGVHVADEAQLQALLAAAGMVFPMVVKPTHGAGKYAVRCVHTLGELFAAIVAFRDNIDAFIKRWVLPRDHAEGLFVEAFLAGGPEVDVDFIASRGEIVFVSINENRPAVGPCFIEAGGFCPPTFPQATHDAIVGLTKKFVSAFGTDLMGCFHFEVIMTPEGPFPLELNARIGGAETFTLLQAAYHVDMAHAALRLALGWRPTPEAFPHAPVARTSSVNFCPCWRGPGRLVAQSVADFVRADPHFVDMELFYAPGAAIAAPEGSAINMGWLVATGATTEEAEAHLQRFCAAISFQFEAL